MASPSFNFDKRQRRNSTLLVESKLRLDRCRIVSSMGDGDRWELTSFDDDFVSRASVVEPAAADRAREAARETREARLRERLDQEARARAEAEAQIERTRRRRHRNIRFSQTAVLGVLAALVTFSVWASRVPPGDARLFRLWESDRPPASSERQRRPLGTPAPRADLGTTFTFIATQPHSTKPVAYDPCRPLHYVVNPSTAPPGHLELFAAAVREVEHATGLHFVYDGLTTENPSEDRAAYLPKRYGKKWAPVLVAWTDASETPNLDGPTVGSAGSRPFGLSPLGGVAPSELVYVSGEVALDGPDLTTVLRLPSGEARVRAVIQHELGHLVGLNHVDDEGELMYASTTDQTDYGPGDLGGLDRLGRGKCFPGI
jgi:hypothetical protein